MAGCLCEDISAIYIVPGRHSGPTKEVPQAATQLLYVGQTPRQTRPSDAVNVAPPPGGRREGGRGAANAKRRSARPNPARKKDVAAVENRDEMCWGNDGDIPVKVHLRAFS